MIQESSPQVQGVHFDTLPTGSTYDNLPVAVIADTPSSTGPHSLAFKLAFSEPVSNVTAAAFQLTATGTAAGTITGVSGSGTNFTVNVGSITGSGTLRLDLPPQSGIQATANSAKVALAYIGGGVESVSAGSVATTPAVTSIAPFTTGPDQYRLRSLYQVTFNEAVSGVNVSNFPVIGSGTAPG